MQLVTYESDGAFRAGILLERMIVDADAAAQAAGLVTVDTQTRWTSPRQFFTLDADGRRQLDAAARKLVTEQATPEQVRMLAGVRLGPPILDPEKIICLGLNYQEHAAEAHLETPVAPMLFAKFRNSLIGPTDSIVLPRISTQIDYEGELAVVIGRTCKEVAVRDALDYVAGVMAFNDVSARDLQMQTSQWMAGKALDTFAPCGPALVLLDEIPEIQNLTLTTRVNDMVVQQANTSAMIFPVRETVSFLSRLMTLQPGDIIATGTPAGVGFQRQPPFYLQAGDVVEVEIERIGMIRNRVVRPEIQEEIPRS
jgi:2-keto-4-pentenoate hydratase/2-oxohepta-3-ene-1,7-dioic acid hydratase in catechol pathway